MGLEAAFPAAPIGSGIDRALARFNQFVIQSAQPIVSLSPFLIPLSIAIAIKLTQWLGPVAAAVFVLPLYGAMFNAEGVLQERALLPPPSARLEGGKNGTYVYKKESYDDAAKAAADKKAKKKPKEVKLSDAQKKVRAERLEEARRLQAIADAGTPLPQAPAPERWATNAVALQPSASNGASSAVRTATSSTVRRAAPAVVNLANSTAVHGATSSTVRTSGYAPVNAANSSGYAPASAANGSGYAPVTAANSTGYAPVKAATGAADANTIAAAVSHINTALYGKPAPPMHTLAEVQQVLNRARLDVGLPAVAASTAAELEQAVAQTTATVGC